MLYVKIPKDLKEYHEKVFAGRTAQELLWLVLAFVSGFIVFIVSYVTVGMQVGSYLTMGIAIPLFLCGFITVQDMTTLDFLKIMVKYYTSRQSLKYHNDLTVYDEKKAKKNKEQKKFRRQLKKMTEND